jgi:acyl-CoA reductase-like NAD-dependent aldehyde dehydrogenase
MYPNTLLYINGAWGPGASGRTLPVVNPASGSQIGTVACAERADLDRALEAADRGFAAWRKVSAFERSKIMRKAANLFRERAEAIAAILTQEQGKPLAEAKQEALAGADIIDWLPRKPPRLRTRRFRHARKASTAHDRAGPVPPSRRGIFRSIRRCASSRPRWRQAARSSSKHRKKRRPRPPNCFAPSPTPAFRQE